MSKTLIAYYSRAAENYFGGKFRYVEQGNTEKVVDMIKEYADADIFRIEMEEPYSDVYKECVAQAKEHLQNNARPAMKTSPASIAEYDRIFLCYPNFCGTIPMVVFTFLEAYDFTDKKIYPLCTNEGSGMGRSVRDIRSLCPGAVVSEGLSVNGSRVDKSKGMIAQWVKESAE